ncbi:MAG: Histidinol dehydrogenase, partial [Phycisphaerales bacterium]|nr:Histidinol dehydrogenase [Phycisphaerales bacterium]
MEQKHRQHGGKLTVDRARVIPTIRRMIPVYQIARPDDAAKIDTLVARLRLDPAGLALGSGPRAEKLKVVHATLADVAARGDAAIVESARKFDDPEFTAARLRVAPDEMAAAHGRIEPAVRDALQRAIDQVREYQSHVMPSDPHPLQRGGLGLKLRFTPLDSVGIYFPGGKASYPSSLIMLAVPAMVAGVKRVVVCSPSGKFGGDLVLAAAHAVGVTEMYRMGGAAAIAALAFGTETIKPVDKIVGPGNEYVQLAKRAVSGAVGVDGFLGPSEILTLADDAADARFVAADLIAQAEHDPGSCFLLTTSRSLVDAVLAEIKTQLTGRQRVAAIEKALLNESMIVVADTFEPLIELANRIACEHINIQTRNDDAMVAKLRHAGAIYVGKYSPVAAGDYVAGPSHCLPTNTTARFSSGISVYEFLKRSSIVTYDAAALAADAPAITTLATAEHLDA